MRVFDSLSNFFGKNRLINWTCKTTPRATKREVNIKIKAAIAACIAVISNEYVLAGDRGHFEPVDALRAGQKRGELVVKKRLPNSPNKELVTGLRYLVTGKEFAAPMLF